MCVCALWHSDIAIALHTPPHRAVSLALVAQALGATQGISRLRRTMTSLSTGSFSLPKGRTMTSLSTGSFSLPKGRTMTSLSTGSFSLPKGRVSSRKAVNVKVRTMTSSQDDM